MSGASALVVGASRGIGEATARSLSAAGARVHVVARSMDALREIAEDIGGEALEMDLLNPSSGSAALARLTDDLGSAPDIAGKGIANPIGQIWSAAMMLEHLGQEEASAAIVTAIEKVIKARDVKTSDMGGKATTAELGKAVEEAL